MKKPDRADRLKSEQSQVKTRSKRKNSARSQELWETQEQALAQVQICKRSEIGDTDDLTLSFEEIGSLFSSFISDLNFNCGERQPGVASDTEKRSRRMKIKKNNGQAKDEGQTSNGGRSNKRVKRDDPQNPKTKRNKEKTASKKVSDLEIITEEVNKENAANKRRIKESNELNSRPESDPKIEVSNLIDQKEPNFNNKDRRELNSENLDNLSHPVNETFHNRTINGILIYSNV